MTPEAPSGAWEQLGVPADQVEQWTAIRFDPFQAALARGDGLTPLIADHRAYRRLFARTAAAWRNSGLSPPCSLRWHRAGFAVAEAARYQRAGMDLDDVRAFRRRPDRSTGSRPG